MTLLTPDLLADRVALRQINRIAHRLRLAYGWHYHLDFIWTLRTLETLGVRPGATVLDAGAGNGVMQFLLAARGYHVISVDYSDRPVSARMRLAYRPSEIPSTQRFEHQYLDHIHRGTASAPRVRGRSAADMLVSVPWLLWQRVSARGSLRRYRADMRHMGAIRTSAVEAVVSISAIEHLDRAVVHEAVQEFRRVLVPGAPIVVTTSAAERETWLHAPSQGLCFAPQDLARTFGITPPDTWPYAHALRALRESDALRALLHTSYFTSGNNGMPWGEWNPEYVPVGVVA